MNDDPRALPRYRPILLTKRGERSALQLCPAATKAALLPVFVVEPIPWDHDEDVPAKSVDSHLATRPRDLVGSWGTRPAAVDLSFLDDTPMQNSDHPLVWLTSQARALGLTLTPAVSVASTPAYRDAARIVAARDHAGACVRLSLFDWPINSGATSALDELLSDVGIPADEVDLVLDLGEEVRSSPGIALTAVRAQLAALPHLHEWRSLTVAGGSFPKGLAGHPRGMLIFERHEWTVFDALINANPPRVPLFGDYAIAHPDPSVDVNPAYMSISASIRYTVDSHWLVPKGDLYKGSGGAGQGSGAVVPLANRLVHAAGWRGASHCDMEAWVRAVTEGASGGRPEEWRKFGTRHHLQVVVEQLAALEA